MVTNIHAKNEKDLVIMMLVTDITGYMDVDDFMLVNILE